MHRSIQTVQKLMPSSHGHRVTTWDITHDAFPGALGPFLVVSLFRMMEPTFPPHPHAGFTVATYMLPESESAFLNHDSTGLSNRIAPGGFHATVAGRGVIHEEQNEEPGRPALGLQIWMNMAAGDKLASPCGISLEAINVPQVSEAGTTVRVIAGQSSGLASPISLQTPVRIVDVTLRSGASFAQLLEEGEQAFVLMTSGNALSSGHEIPALAVATTGDNAGELRLIAGRDGARFILFAGRPVAGPVFQSGPFVGSTPEQVASFQQDFRLGRMGRLTPFSILHGGSVLPTR